MAGKLVRNTSTEALRQWWEAVEKIAAEAPKLNLGAGTQPEAGSGAAESIQAPPPDRGQER